MTITIGQRLKTAREDQRLTLEKVFEATRIRVQYLQALEDDDFSAMPSPVQARGYLRNYAEFLGFDVTRLLEEQREASTQKPADVVIGPTDIPEAQEVQAPASEAAIPDSPAVEDTTPLLKPKPARRKKVDASPGTESATAPKRRSRKKAELDPELVAALASQQEPFDVAEKPALVEEPVVPEPEEISPANEEPPDAAVEPPQAPEPTPETDINESNWQTWLNRLGAILAARNKRQTLVVKETTGSESPFIDDSPLPVPSESAGQDEAALTDENAESSTQIFKEIGRELRERRELLSLHLEEVERNTHVKAHYLDALERGAIDDLPSTVQTRGMLSNYATFLDLDVDAILLRFADALQARYRERNPQKPVRKPGQPIVANLPPMRSFIAGDLIFGVGIVVLLVGFAIWGVSRVLTLQSQRAVDATAPSISEILLASPEVRSATGTPTERPIEAFPGQPTVTVVIPTLNENVNVQVNLVAAERTYMRVTADGEVVFDGRVLPGTAYPFEAVDQIEVLVGNGAAIRIVYNGRDLGLLGSFGQVVNNIYMANEVVTPTSLPTETATITLTPTRTEVPSATPRISATPAPSATAVP